MFDQELREGERRKEGESFKKFAGRRLLVAFVALIGVVAIAYLLFSLSP